MDRILLDRAVETNQEIVIEGPPLEALRFQGGRIGGIVTVTDSKGNDFRARVLRISSREASLLIFDTFPSPTESSAEIILLQALPEKERMELIIQKATELGVSAILIFESARSISLKERESKQKKAHRWQDIAIKAVQQSRRAKVPQVTYCSFDRRGLRCVQRRRAESPPVGEGGRKPEKTAETESSGKGLCHGRTGGRVHPGGGHAGQRSRFCSRKTGTADPPDGNRCHHPGGDSSV